ncbi:MAG: D-2-hydroxyacid dehydrogenase [Pseudomonadota bacterium]
MARVFAMELGMRAVFLDVASVGEDITTAPLAAAVDSLALYDVTAADDVIERSQGADVVITNKCRFDADTLAALPKLRYIGLTATGADGVDLVAAGARGIAVTNITAYCTQSVAQHVFAVLLALTHRIVDYDTRVQAGGWQRPGNFCLLDFPIRELTERVMGIVGYGELGRAVARLAEAFGMTVRVAQRDAGDDRPGRVPIESLFEVADVISLHCPLDASTHHLVDAAMLARMKPDAVLINTARGGLVDAEALAAALREERIGGAAIDVLEQEPPVDGNALIGAGLHNLIVTPHTAWAAREARQRAIDQTAENLRVFLNDGRRNRIDIDPDD